MTSRAKWCGLLMAVLVIGSFGQTITAHAGGGNRVFLPVVRRVEETEPPSAFEQQVIDMTNRERAANGCAPLRVESHLMAAAEAHSRDMAENDFFSHTGSNGSSPWDRMADAGYDGYAAAENVAAGYSTPDAVVAGWMNSPGHRGNILNCDLEEIGVGYVYHNPDTGSQNWVHYWTQDFGIPQ